MKSLFDRIKVYQYLDTPGELPLSEAADGIVIHVAENTDGYLSLIRKTEQPIPAAACTGNCSTCASACQKTDSDGVPSPENKTAHPQSNPTDLSDFLRAHMADAYAILLFVDTPLSETAQRDLLTTLKRTDMTHRICLVSRYHKTLDALQKAEPALRISPLCGEELVRPWIYAAYMGAAMLCMDARDILLDADRYGAPLVDRAHNNSVTVCAWNAEDEDTIRALVTVGCDAILTHIPETARALVW